MSTSFRSRQALLAAAVTLSGVELTQTHQIGGARRPVPASNNNRTMKSIRNIENRILAMATASPAIPPNPNTAAINANTKNSKLRRKLKTLVHGLNRLKRRQNITRDHLLERLAVLKKEAGRVASFIHIRKPQPDEPINRQTFTCTFKREAWKQAMERDGCYILRAYVPWEDWPVELEKQAPVLWEWYR
jgi:hypothetical protein